VILSARCLCALFSDDAIGMTVKKDAFGEGLAFPTGLACRPDVISQVEIAPYQAGKLGERRLALSWAFAP
jgi:hypothetical protein